MIIDTDDYAASGIKTLKFAGGEWHCEVSTIPSLVVHIHAKIRTWDAFGELMVVCNALRRNLHDVYLFMPYLPGARQDRVTAPGTPFTCEITAKMLDIMCDHVTVVDIHSRVAHDTLKKFMGEGRVTALSNHWMLPGFVQKPSHVIAPDKGALDRAQNAAFAFGGGVKSLPVIECTKERDPATGHLSHFVVPVLPGDAGRYLIVDDICDGGGTFVGLLEEIRKWTNVPVDLFVTHGIFSKGVGVLNGFDNIYTTDSFVQGYDTYLKLHVLPLLPYYLEGLTP